MPRSYMFTKEQVLDAAIELTREKGFSAVSARSLGDRLGTTSRPIFSHFENMADVQKGIIGAANKLYQSFREEEIKSGRYVPYKASGMAYIRFAKEEKEVETIKEAVRGIRTVRTSMNVPNSKKATVYVVSELSLIHI